MKTGLEWKRRTLLTLGRGSDPIALRGLSASVKYNAIMLQRTSNCVERDPQSRVRRSMYVK
jgi:hypothetical protein